MRGRKYPSCELVLPGCKPHHPDHLHPTRIVAGKLLERCVELHFCCCLFRDLPIEGPGVGRINLLLSEDTRPAQVPPTPTPSFIDSCLLVFVPIVPEAVRRVLDILSGSMSLSPSSPSPRLLPFLPQLLGPLSRYPTPKVFAQWNKDIVRSSKFCHENTVGRSFLNSAIR